MELEIRELNRNTPEAYAAAAICQAEIYTDRGPYRLRWYDGQEVYAAFIQGDMVGMSQVYPDPANRKSFHVARLAVTSAFQRQGIGTALIAHAANLARERGYEKLSTYPITDRSELFYASQGFEQKDPDGYFKDMFRNLMLDDR